MLEIVSQFLNQGLSYIVPLVVLLGLLIFIHELGHFLMARFFGVGVEVFSIGFGPKMVRWVWGETTYCISALPFGGYVKMYGDVPGESLPREKQHLSFIHRPVGQRICVFLAGPLMNLFFAAFLFYWVAQLGDTTTLARVGEISPRSQAYGVGFRPLDEIVSINGVAVERWSQVESRIEDSAQEPLIFEIRRQGHQLHSLTVTPEERASEKVFSTKNLVGSIEGLHNNLHKPLVGIQKGPFESMGLRNGDYILEINGEKVDWFKDIKPLILKKMEKGEGQIQVKWRRYGDWTQGDSFQDMEKTVSASLFSGLGPKNLSSESQWGGLFVPETILAHVEEDTPASRAGLQMGDQIKAINGKSVESFQDIIDGVSSYSQERGALKLDVLRQEGLRIFYITPQMTSLEGDEGQKESRFTIGVRPFVSIAPQTFVWQTRGWVSVHRAFEQTMFWSQLVTLGLIRIVQNKISSKNIGGLISIGQVAQKSWSIGASSFIKMMAILSINLFVLNLLPIPMLDGGQLVLLLVEAIKGSPISLKKMLIVQQVGFFILLSLMVFALFNDFSRIFGS